MQTIIESNQVITKTEEIMGYFLWIHQRQIYLVPLYVVFILLIEFLMLVVAFFYLTREELLRYIVYDPIKHKADTCKVLSTNKEHQGDKYLLVCTKAK